MVLPWSFPLQIQPLKYYRQEPETWLETEYRITNTLRVRFHVGADKMWNDEHGGVKVKCGINSAQAANWLTKCNFSCHFFAFYTAGWNYLVSRCRKIVDRGRVAMQDRSRPVSSSASVIGWETRPVLIFETGLGFATRPGCYFNGLSWHYITDNGCPTQTSIARLLRFVIQSA